MGLGTPLPAGKRGSLISPGTSPFPGEPPPEVPPESGPVLLYDGACGVCARSIQFILRHDRRDRSLRFASLQSDFGRRILAAVPELEGVDSVVWVDVDPASHPDARPGSRPDTRPGTGSGTPVAAHRDRSARPPRLVPGAPLPPLRTRIRSDAALTAATYLGGGWRWMARAARIFPRRLRDAVYDLVARNRHRLAGRSDRCLLPTPDERRRFLDGPDAEPGAADPAR